MPRIILKETLAPRTHYFRIEVPLIARHAEAGQFVIIRVDEEGERVPFTIADFDPAEGSITLVIQEVGETTRQIGALNTGDEFRDVLGPLGAPSEIEKFGTVCLLGGGFGIAAIHVLAKALREAGNRVVSIIGARTKDLLIMEEEMRRVSDELVIMTDDGSCGRKGLVVEPLKEMLEAGALQRVCAVGPIPMMRAVGEMTRPYGVKTIVSLNPVMVDGTGMCGGCRVEVGGVTKFACVDGPEFDAHETNFEELIHRTQMYRKMERRDPEQCRLMQAAPKA
jgi:ferredoxin/flavodoxin---NADP+ reductase